MPIFIHFSSSNMQLKKSAEIELAVPPGYHYDDDDDPLLHSSKPNTKSSKRNQRKKEKRKQLQEQQHEVQISFIIFPNHELFSLVLV